MVDIIVSRAQSPRSRNHLFLPKPIPHDNKTGDAEYIKKNFLEAPLFQNVRSYYFLKFLWFFILGWKYNDEIFRIGCDQDKVGFQVDALNTLSDWSITSKPEHDWLI